MDRYADGDAAAFAGVYDLLAPRLLSFFVRNAGDRSAAEDLAQQTFFHIHRARASFVRGSDVVPWAFAIGRRLLIDARRRRKNEVLLESDDDAKSSLEVRASRDAIPDEVAGAKQLAARAHAEIQRMPEPQRAAYQLVRDEGLSVADAARVLGTTVTAVKQRVFRASEALRAALGLVADGK